MLWLAAATVTVLWALPGAAWADGDCIDAISGGGSVTSSVSGGKAKFSLTAGYLTPDAPLGGFIQVGDSGADFKMKSLSVDDYGGYHCAGFDPSGGPCYERWFTGTAQIEQGKTKTTRMFIIDTIITPNSDAPDYIVWNPDGCPDPNNCFFSFQLVTKGLISITDPDMTTPGCQ
jgi:hypothetical protein